MLFANHNPGGPGFKLLDSLDFFFFFSRGGGGGSVLGQNTSGPSLLLVKPRKGMNISSSHRDMTEINVESGVKHLPNKPCFLRVCSRSLLKTLWKKEKLLVTSYFFFSHSVFYLFRELSAIFIKFEIVVCKVFQFGRA